MALMLGKLPKKEDSRTLQFRAVLKAAPPAPPAYDFDAAHLGIPTPMFGNDRYGDCVIAGRAHQTLRFELIDEGKIISITDKEVEEEYFKETGGPDSGLVVLDSLKLWRNEGWTAGGDNDKIKAFAEIDPKDHEGIRAAIYADIGCGMGFLVTQAAMDQFNAGEKWDVVKGDDGGELGGHYVHCPAYNEIGPICVTWGQRQQMTWAFVDKYADEFYAIIDQLDGPGPNPDPVTPPPAPKPTFDWAAIIKFLEDLFSSKP